MTARCAARFGSQAVVVAIDARRIDADAPFPSGFEVVVKGGREPAGLDAVAWAERAVELGAGELLVTSIDRDGTKSGYDTELLAAITSRVRVPVIASGGASGAAHMVEAIRDGGADAVLAASIFHRRELSIGDVKAAARGRRHPGPPGHRHGGARVSPLPDPARSTSTAGSIPHLRWDRNGLVVGVVQDVADGRVLMVGWMDVEALAATLGTGDVHFHSRSRGRLWRKGESSGHVLRLRSLALDCDGDALLIGAEPLGPTCHRETRSCFDPDALSRAVPGFDPGDATPAPGSDPMEAAPGERRLAGLRVARGPVGDDRRAGRAATPGSYTVELLDGGVDAAGRKVAEEATEVCSRRRTTRRPRRPAPTGPSSRAVAGEAGDLVYHALVLLAERGVGAAAVIAALRPPRAHGPA